MASTPPPFFLGPVFYRRMTRRIAGSERAAAGDGRAASAERAAEGRVAPLTQPGNVSRDTDTHTLPRHRPRPPTDTPTAGPTRASTQLLQRRRVRRRLALK